MQVHWPLPWSTSTCQFDDIDLAMASRIGFHQIIASRFWLFNPWSMLCEWMFGTREIVCHSLRLLLMSLRMAWWDGWTIVGVSIVFFPFVMPTRLNTNITNPFSPISNNVRSGVDSIVPLFDQHSWHELLSCSNTSLLSMCLSWCCHWCTFASCPIINRGCEQICSQFLSNTYWYQCWRAWS